MKSRVVFLAGTLFLACLLICGGASAHHSMSMYDRGHDTTFKAATITQFEWVNPHSQITFTIADEHGNTVKWVAEGPGPNRLANHGWTKDSLKPGDQVTIIGNVNKDGSSTMRFEKIVFANGQTLEGRPRSFFR